MYPIFNATRTLAIIYIKADFINEGR